MIRIFNKKINTEIIFDDQVEWIKFNPRDYEEKPYIIIEFKNFSYPHHAKKCSDCKKFMESFGKESLDWYISYYDKTYRLDMKELGQGRHPSNEIRITMSEYESGTKMTLIFHQLPTDKNELESLLDKAVLVEDYEEACTLRDLIN